MQENARIPIALGEYVKTVARGFRWVSFSVRTVGKLDKNCRMFRFCRFLRRFGLGKNLAISPDSLMEQLDSDDLLSKIPLIELLMTVEMLWPTG
jgi:hypothetical protein